MKACVVYLFRINDRIQNCGGINRPSYTSKLIDLIQLHVSVW